MTAADLNMSTTFTFQDFLTDSLEENAGIISDTLRQIRSVLSENDALAKMVPLVIKDKSQNEQARFENLLHYRLDHQTLQYLETHHDEWLAVPSAFDTKLKSSQKTFAPQGTRAVKVRRKHPNYLPQVGKAHIELYGAPVIETDTLKKTVADMVTTAGHYKNWEKELGTQGVAIVLGNKWPEGSWTKLVGKSGSKFEQILNRLRKVKLPEQAKKYANLEKKLVEFKVEGMLAELGNQ